MFNIKKNKIDKVSKDLIIPIYLNQRIIYDTLAIINDGFTELYNVSDITNNEREHGGTLSGDIGNDNKFSFVKANIDVKLNDNIKSSVNTSNQYKKVHTAASLFSNVYTYIKENDKLIKLINEEDISKVQCGNFVEFMSTISINTLEETLNTARKVLALGQLFSKFDKGSKNNELNNFTKSLDELINFLDLSNQGIKYGVCNIDNKEIVVKIDKEYLINKDFHQINNGKFRIVGKVFEVIEDNEIVNLNRESALGMINPPYLIQLKKSIESLGNPMFKFNDIKDEVRGKSLIIMPIMIGI